MAVSRLHDPSAPARFQREARALASIDHPGWSPCTTTGSTRATSSWSWHWCGAATWLGGSRATAASRRSAPRARPRHRGRPGRGARPGPGAPRHQAVERAAQGPDERPVLCDFGLAKADDGSDQLTATGQAPGTVQYMSPEQLRNDPVTASSDIYAFGCLLFHCLTGRPPYTGADAIEVMHGHLEGPLPDARAFNAQLPAAVQDVLARCLDKVPARRWRTARAVADGLQQAFSPASTQALQPDARLGCPRRRTGRRRLLTASRCRWPGSRGRALPMPLTIRCRPAAAAAGVALRRPLRPPSRAACSWPAPVSCWWASWEAARTDCCPVGRRRRADGRRGLGRRLGRRGPGGRARGSRGHLDGRGAGARRSAGRRLRRLLTPRALSRPAGEAELRPDAGGHRQPAHRAVREPGGDGGRLPHPLRRRRQVRAGRPCRDFAGGPAAKGSGHVSSWPTWGPSPAT
jgi:hypothetical protein